MKNFLVRVRVKIDGISDTNIAAESLSEALEEAKKRAAHLHPPAFFLTTAKLESIQGVELPWGPNAYE